MTRTLSLFIALFLSTVAAAQQPGFLTVSLPPFEYIGDSDIAHGFATVKNDTAADIHDVLVTVDMSTNSPGDTYLGGEGCVNFETPYVVHCTMPLIRAGQSLPLQLYIGPVHEERFFLTANVHANTPPVPAARRSIAFPREVFVTNTGDSGEGSLRAAIEYANDVCTRDLVPCRATFRIDAPVPESGWYTIYPNTPLPAITAYDFEIDGSTQTRFSGDTNPQGPEILLDGSALAAGHGLQLAGSSGYAFVSNIAIGGFPWNGITVTRDSYSRSEIRDNYIGTDPTGTRALPNRSRGITFDGAARYFDVVHNLISGNGRSGVFLAAAGYVVLRENTIGAGVGGVPIPNGASGLLIGPKAYELLVERNTIAYNTKFGVALDPLVAQYALVDNSITRNGFIGIDRGLDGFSGYEGGYNIPNAKVPPPRLVSAIYDPVANATTIEGTYFDARLQYGTWELTLFRNTVNDGQGEFVIGHTIAASNLFTLTVPGDLRGQFITATGQHGLFIEIGGPYYWTTEFSESIEVR